MILDHPLISHRYFFPRAESVDPPVIISADGADLHCFQSQYPNSGPVMLHFHGNGEVVADYTGPIDRAFSECGVNTTFVEYRGYGGSSGTPQLGKMLADTKSVIESLEIDPTNLWVFGRSVGSIYAIEVARRYPQLKGLIIESGIADPLQRLLLRMEPSELGASLKDLQEAAHAHLNHQAVLQNYKGPSLFLHTRYDGIVDLDHAQQNYAWSTSPQKKLKIFERGNHNSIMGENWDEYFKEVADFISAHQ